MIQDPQISGKFLVLKRVFIAKHRLQMILSPSIFGATSPVFELIKVAQNRLNDEKCWGTSQNERRNLLSASWSNKNSIFLERKMLSFLGDGNWDVENAFLASNQPKRVPTKDQQPAPTQLGKLPSPSRFFSRCAKAMRPYLSTPSTPGLSLAHLVLCLLDGLLALLCRTRQGLWSF